MKLRDIRKIIEETMDDISVADDDIDISEDEEYDDFELEEDMSGGHAQSRAAMSRPTGHMDMRYDDLDDDEMTVPRGRSDEVGCHDGRSLRDMLSEEMDDAQKRRISARNRIRNQLDLVWVALGKAETKLGSAQFDAEDMNFKRTNASLEKLISNVRKLMAMIEKARDQIG